MNKLKMAEEETLKDKIQISCNLKEGCFTVLKVKDVQEAVTKFDKLLKSDILTDAENGNEKPSPETWNKYIKRQRQRIKEIFGDF